LSSTLAEFNKDSRPTRSSYSNNFSRFTGGQIECEILDDLTHFTFANF
jgi:hypothetical protein